MLEWKPTVKSKFFTNREILIYLFLFVGVCVLLFPKERLKTYVLVPERVNLELSIIYAKNILKTQEDPLFRLHLVDSLIQAGRLEEAEREAKKLIGTQYTQRAYLALFKIEKIRYFSGKMSNKNLLQEYLLSALESTKEKELLIEIRKEALSMDLPEVVMISTERLYMLDRNVNWLKEAYNYAIALGKTEKALIYAFELYKSDPRGREQYINDIVYLLKKEPSGQQILEKQKKFIGEALYQNIITKLTTEVVASANTPIAIIEYTELFKKTKDYSERKKLFRKIVQLYLWSGDYQGLKVFISTYYKEFIRDKELARFILKSSMETGDTNFAQEIAKDIKEVYLK